MGLETVDLDGLAIKTEALLLVGEEVLNVLSLITLELDHLSHLGVGNDGAIAGCRRRLEFLCRERRRLV